MKYMCDLRFPGVSLTALGLDVCGIVVENWDVILVDLSFDEYECSFPSLLSTFLLKSILSDVRIFIVH